MAAPHLKSRSEAANKDLLKAFDADVASGLRARTYLEVAMENRDVRLHQMLSEMQKAADDVVSVVNDLLRAVNGHRPLTAARCVGRTSDVKQFPTAADAIGRVVFQLRLLEASINLSGRPSEKRRRMRQRQSPDSLPSLEGADLPIDSADESP